MSLGGSGVSIGGGDGFLGYLVGKVNGSTKNRSYHSHPWLGVFLFA